MRQWAEVCVRYAVCLWLSHGESCAGCVAVVSAPEGCAVVVEGGVCSFEHVLSGSRLLRDGVVCRVFSSLSADCVVVLRLCGPSQGGAQMSTDLRHRPIGVVRCARLWQALAGALGSKTVVTDWLSGNTEAIEVALWLTMLPCVVSRGRFGDAWMSMTVSFGSEAEGAARASAGNCSMLTQK
eukprot:scaffold1130_cov127-Isochrysis_galbana.AAC.5